MTTPILPPYAAEEFTALDREGWPRISEAWTAVSHYGGTMFRRDLVPHHDRDDRDFRIMVPVSGGLDSATCYRMAVEAGLPVVPVMVDTGVPYVPHDMDAARRIAPDLIVLDRAREWQTTADFQVGRNSVIVWELFHMAAAHDWWGEVWFGNLGGQHLETPIVGGDKSYRWLSAMQHLATATGRDFRIASPLGGMSKADAVSWWAARGLLGYALTTRSCFADQAHHCGCCWACLQRFIAFTARGHRRQIEPTYPDGHDFTEAAREFWRRATTWKLVTTSRPRMQEAANVLDDIGLGITWWNAVNA